MSAEAVSPPATMTYRLLMLTRQGGVQKDGTVFVGEIPNLIFADGFESGDTLAWDSSSP